MLHILDAARDHKQRDCVYLSGLDGFVWKYNSSTHDLSLSRGIQGSVTNLFENGNITYHTRYNEVVNSDAKGTRLASYNFLDDPEWSVIACREAPLQIFAHHKEGKRILVTRRSEDLSATHWEYQNGSFIREIEYLQLRGCAGRK